jgi:hypothetical protein
LATGSTPVSFGGKAGGVGLSDSVSDFTETGFLKSLSCNDLRIAVHTPPGGALRCADCRDYEKRFSELTSENQPPTVPKSRRGESAR